MTIIESMFELQMTQNFKKQKTKKTLNNFIPNCVHLASKMCNTSLETDVEIC